MFIIVIVAGVVSIGQELYKQANTSVEWKEYSFEESGFKISLPTEPKKQMNEAVRTREKNILFNNTFYISEMASSDTFFAVMKNEYYGDLNSGLSEQDVEESIQKITNSNSVLEDVIADDFEYNTLISSKKGLLHGYETLDYEIRNKAPDRYEAISIGRIISVDNVIYQLVVAYTPDDYNSEEANTFLDSFDLLTVIN